MNNKQSINIVIFADNFRWSGGMEFIRILANAMVQKEQEVECNVTLLFCKRYLLHGLHDSIWTFLRVLKDILIKHHIEPIQNSNMQSFFDYMKNIEGNINVEFYNGRDESLLSCLNRIEPDVFFASRNILGKKISIPWISYIADFQHKYYHEYFSSEECLNRDIHYATIIRDAPAILVNSYSVYEDIYRFYPYACSRIFSLPFAAAPMANWFLPPPKDICQKYGIPKKFFIICNQFWKHKSHITAFEALHDLISRKGNNEYCHIVCTGNTDDYRFPSYYKELKEKIEAIGIKDKVFFLGFIPKIDQIQLMKESIAVIQPTLFEGGPGGGSIYDAISLGVPAIISDIPVNREIDSELLRFFPVGSFKELSIAMEDFAKYPPQRRKAEDLIKEGRLRTSQLRQTILDAIRFVTNGTTLKAR